MITEFKSNGILIFKCLLRDILILVFQIPDRRKRNKLKCKRYMGQYSVVSKKWPHN